MYVYKPSHIAIFVNWPTHYHNLCPNNNLEREESVFFCATTVLPKVGADPPKGGELL